MQDYIRNDAANLKNDVSEVRDVIGSKRVTAAVMVNPKVQEAAVEKGIEVAGKLVDKQLQTIDGAQRKAADFLKKEVSTSNSGKQQTAPWDWIHNSLFNCNPQKFYNCVFIFEWQPIRE